MYAIIHKNNVVVGPKEWSRGFFVFRLSQLGLKDVVLPRSAPESLPFTIDGATKIVRALINQDDYNPNTEYLTGPIWNIDGDVAIANYVKTESPIEAVKNNLRQLAAAERYKKEVSGTKTLVKDIEVSLDTSREGRNIFIQKLMLMSENDLVNWKFPEAWLTLSRNELASVVQSGANYIQTCFDWEKDINDQIDIAETAEQLLSIVIVETSEGIEDGTT